MEKEEIKCLRLFLFPLVFSRLKARALAVFSLNITLAIHTSLTCFTRYIDRVFGCWCVFVCLVFSDSWKADTELTDRGYDMIE